MIIRVENLRKSYKKELVLREINMTIEKPHILALVGPNGSGKTTLLNCMTNLIGFGEGTIELVGKKHTDPTLFKEVSFLQDNRILYDYLTGYDHLKFICSVQGIDYSAIQKVAERVGMVTYLKKRVRNYSLGMKQHLLLAMAIINEPKLLLMDEPLTGLDPTSAINMRNILLELHDEGTTILLSSHNLAEIDRLTNTIFFMKNGALLKESLLNLDKKQYIVTVNDSTKVVNLLQETSIPHQIPRSNQIAFLETDMDLQTFILQMIEIGIVIHDVDKQKIGAEQRYQELFEGVGST